MGTHHHLDRLQSHSSEVAYMSR